MKLLTAAQLRAADNYTISNEPIPSVDLMERAATVCFKWIAERFSPDIRFMVICGMGNNGGDGLAIARMLHEKGYDTEVFILPYFSKQSTDFEINRKRLTGIKVTDSARLPLWGESSVNKCNESPRTVIIDAIFGSGLSRPIEGKLAEVIDLINSLNFPVIAIDMPSGLMMDYQNSSEKGGSRHSSPNLKTEHVIRATYTLAFETPKLPFFFSENDIYVGEFVILDIGLDKKFLSEQKTTDYYITRQDIRKILKPRPRFSHKGTFGHALIIAGSIGKIGAAVLASKACLRAGAGLLTVHIPQCGYSVLQTAIPEAMVSIDEQDNEFSGIKNLDKFNVIGVGPGIGQADKTVRALKLLIQNSSVPMVLDADALNILAENKTWLSFLPKDSILTPHPGEFARLARNTSSGYDAYITQKEFAIKHSVYVVLKGAFTSIAAPSGDVFFNSTGNPGMATAGSGDTLTGIITGLLAHGYSSAEAAILGVYLHGLAGDIAAEERGREGMIAGDIINRLGKAFREISDNGIPPLSENG